MLLLPAPPPRAPPPSPRTALASAAAAFEAATPPDATLASLHVVPVFASHNTVSSRFSPSPSAAPPRWTPGLPSWHAAALADGVRNTTYGRAIAAAVERASVRAAARAAVGGWASGGRRRWRVSRPFRRPRRHRRRARRHRHRAPARRRRPGARPGGWGGRRGQSDHAARACRLAHRGRRPPPSAPSAPTSSLPTLLTLACWAGMRLRPFPPSWRASGRPAWRWCRGRPRSGAAGRHSLFLHLPPPHSLL